MSDHVFWIVDFALNDGALADFKALVQEMVDATRGKEPGALNYEWSISEDGKRVHIFERYKDSAAVLAHMANVGPTYIPRLMGLGHPTGFTVYGSPNAEARKMLETVHPTYMKPVNGFSR